MVETTCIYYDGDDDCMKWVKHGILLYGCSQEDCEDYTDHAKGQKMKAKWIKEYGSIGEFPLCPKCEEPLYEQDKCVFCGQKIDSEPKLIEWFKPSPIETMDCFMCGGKDTVKYKRSKYNGHKRGRCDACGMTFIE